MLRFLTAGESHGPKLTIILDGIPAGLSLPPEAVDEELKKRQLTPGRSMRMTIEEDRAVFTAGIRGGRTMGGPIAVEIGNQIFERQKEIWSEPLPDPITVPRPGHADLAGWAKFEGADIRNVIERASARETAARIVAGAIARRLLSEFGIRTGYKIRSIGAVKDLGPFDWEKDRDRACDKTMCDDPEIESAWKALLAAAESSGDSIGGRFECRMRNLPMGLGSYSQWDRRLDGRIARAIMSIPGVKAAAIGDGMEADQFSGDDFRDPIRFGEQGRIERQGNHAGGLEGGITTGQDLVVHGVMKPIPGVRIPTGSIDLAEQKPHPSRHERADTCVVQAAAVIGVNVIAWEIADAMIERYGGDTVDSMRAALARDREGLQRGWRSPSSR